MSHLTYHRRTDAVYTSWLTNDMNTINQQGLRYFSYMIQAIWQVLLSAIVLVNYQIGFTDCYIGSYCPVDSTAALSQTTGPSRCRI